MTRILQSTRNLPHKIAEYITQPKVRRDIQARAEEVELQELRRLHLHAARQRRRHRIHAGNKLRKQKRHASALIERLRRPQNARLRIQRQAADKTQQRPTRVAPQQKQQQIAEHCSRDRCQQYLWNSKNVRRSGSSGSNQRQSGWRRKPRRFRKHHQEDQQIPVM